MRKVFNFSAGPAMVAEEVLLQAQAEMLDWHGTGMSIMELSHRGAEFKTVVDQAETDLRELMTIPKNYHVLFLAGGASAQFSMVPLNLLAENKKADYIDTGIWSKKAIMEAKRYGNIHVAAQLDEGGGLARIPSQAIWSLRQDAAYVHYTPNETIGGVEFHWLPQTGQVPLVADMSSTILSRPIDVSAYGLIYAGAQKNIGQAGITLVIIRDDLVREFLPGTPILYQYSIQVENASFYNTPPTYSWYIAGLTLAWMKKQGGIRVFAERNQRKAQKLYEAIDNSGGFYVNSVDPECRSRMNIPFNLRTDSLTTLFLDETKKAGLTNLRGHKLVGGVRASIYNSMPEEGVDALVGFMQEFAQRYG
ncbi:MAG: serC [Gammaproteobacteria bacterium]|jgi:phosphoserine aminotransferase|nr:serC [Gammaproteobacteria bacterium]